MDFACRDRVASRETHVATGASVVSEHEFWTVMRDPAGRIYCLTHRLP
ncbi:MAG: VOC family protein [Knoellia sp.]